MNQQLKAVVRTTPNPQFLRRSFLGASIAGAAATLTGHSPCAATDQGQLPPDSIYQSATSIRNAIRAREVSPVEVVQRYISRIEDIDPFLNAVTYFPNQTQALIEAERLEDKIKRGNVKWESMPLLGVPVSIKDMFDVKGMPNTCGDPSRSEIRATSDATAVKKLKEAGAIVLARTNVPLDCAAYETDNLLHGRTNNPYDTSRTPGGSSGGEAALIAAGGSPLGLGGDSGGSILVPAHSCGIAGLVPAWGRVSTAGVKPFQPNIPPFYVGVGPMARWVEDIALMLPIISGEDHRDPFTFPLQFQDYRNVKIESLRVAYCTRAGSIEPTEETKNTVKAAAEKLADRCKQCAESFPPYFEVKEPQWIVGAFSLPSTKEAVSEARQKLQNLEDPLIKEGLRRGLEALEERDLAQLARTRASLPEIQQSILKFMSEKDVLLCPVNQNPAIKHGESWGHIIKGGTFFAEFFALLGNLPKGVVRCGTSPEGLPIGVQVVGAPYREDIVLAVMDFLEEQFGVFQPPSETALRATS